MTAQTRDPSTNLRQLARLPLMPQSLRSIIDKAQFNSSVRGYDRGQVDDFLERIADMGWVQEDSLPPTVAQSIIPPPPPPPGPTPAPPEAQALQVLTLAQRTADETVAEAQRQAAATTAAANEAAAKLRADAQAHAAAVEAAARQLLDDTQAQARRDAADARVALKAEKAAAQGELDALLQHVATQRLSVTYTTEQLQQLLANPAAFRVDGFPYSTTTP